MEQTETKKTYKIAALVTYAIALVSLLAGLFLPLFDGKQILALQLPQILNAAAGKNILKFGKEYTLAFPINFLGIAKQTDVLAWTLLLYFAVTALGFIALIPVIVGTVKQKFYKAACVSAYVLETAAVMLLAVYLMLGMQFLPANKIAYNLLVPLGGCLLPLIVLNCINKKSAGAVKTVLFALSCIAFLTLFNYLAVNEKLASGLDKLAGKLKLSPLFFGNAENSTAGISYLTLLFAAPKGMLKDTFALMPDAKNKAALALGIICAGAAMLNFFADVIGLSTNAKQPGRVFNIGRYALELGAAACLFITLAVCKYRIGLLLIILAVAAAIQLAINIILFVLYLLKNRSEEDKQAKLTEKEARRQSKEEKKAAVAPASVYAEKKPAPDKRKRDEYVLNPYVTSPPPVTEYSQQNPYRVKTDVDKPAQRYSQPPQYNPAPAPAPAPQPQPQPEPEKPKYASNVSYEQTERKPAPEPAFPAYNPPAPPVQQPQPQPEQVVEQTRVYKVNTLYQGPTDDFMKKLTNDEKVEFSMAFIERSKGEIGNVPDYIIGGDNRKFFSAVFIYLGRIRGIVSDNLLNKMYKELNML